MYVSYGLTFSSLRAGSFVRVRGGRTAILRGELAEEKIFPSVIPLAGWWLAAAKIFPKLAQENMLAGYDCCSTSARKHYTVEPSFTNARLINGQFRLS